MTAVFDHSESTGSDRLVLLVIADRSDDSGRGCWRGKESIAHMARVDRATVTRSIARLEALGELVVDRRPGRTSEYRISLPGVTDSEDGPARSVANPAQIAPTPENGGRRNLRLHPAQDAPTPGAPVRRDTSLDVSYTRAPTAPRGRSAPATPPAPAPPAHREPGRVNLGRGLGAPPLWDIDADGNAVWRGDAPPRAAEDGPPEWVPGSSRQIEATDAGRAAIAAARDLARARGKPPTPDPDPEPEA